MADSQLNIIVTTEDSRLLALIAKLNAGTLSVAEYNKEVRAMRAAAIVGSRAQMDLKNVVTQVGEQTLTTNGQIMKSYFSVGEALRVQEAGERGITGTIRAAREERRMYMFAVREGMQAVTSFTGTESRLTKVMTEGTSAVFSMKFALDMMGGTIAKFALPLALMIGAWTILKELFGKSAEESKKLTEELAKQSSTMEGLIENLHKLNLVSDEQLKNMYRTQIAALEIASAQKTTKKEVYYEMGPEGKLPFLREVTGYTLLEEQRLENFKKITDLKLKIQGIDKEETSELDKQQKIVMDTADAQYKLAMKRWEIEIKQRELARTSPEYRAAAAMFGGPAVPLVPGAAMTRLRGVGAGGVSPEFVGGVKQTSLEMKLIQKEIGTADSLVSTMTDSMAGGFQEATAYLAEGFQRAFGLGNSLLDRMISTFATSALMALPGAIASFMTAGATSNPFTAIFASFQHGGVIPEPVIGMGLQSRKVYSFAEKGPEYVSNINQMGQAGRYGGGQSFQPSVQVIPLLTNEGIAVRVIMGNKSRGGLLY